MGDTLPNTEFLYDLLYVDGKRVATYIAQLDPNGNLTGIKTSGLSTTSFAGGGKLGVVVASGTLNAAEAVSEGQEKQFDPLWVLPITLLNRLDELGYIHRKLLDGRIGSLVLINGWCRLVDIRLIKEMWPAVARLQRMTAGDDAYSQSRAERRRNAPQKSPNQNDEVIADIVSKLPHLMELHVVTEDGLIWTTLDPACLITSTNDSMLKHGSELPGDWFVLGILDARPYESQGREWEAVPANPIAQAIIPFLSIVRSAMGRPDGHYGVTPILIFRVIRRPAPASD